jgi:CheY-like chemotaxis protein
MSEMTQPTSSAPAPPGPGILLLDDETFARQELRRVLTKKGFSNVQEARDSAEALQQVAKGEIGVVVLDLQLEDGPDGIETARQIQEVHPETSFIVVSAYASESAYHERAAVEQLRVVEWIEKPIQPALPKLIETLQQVTSQEPVMALAASINAVYDKMRALVQSNGGKPGLREALVPLREKLRILQKQEAREIEQRYDAHFRASDEKVARLFEETDRLINRTSKLLERR